MPDPNLQILYSSAMVGRRAIPFFDSSKDFSYLFSIKEIVDPFLLGKVNPKSLRKFGETIEKCLQENDTDRPNMMDVLWDLNYARQL